MPSILPATIRSIAAAVDARDAIAAPAYHDTRGHPVVFGASHLPALGRCTGDRGATGLLATHALTLVPTEDPGVLADIDTPADLDHRPGSEQ
jgi:molybdenum cofactor cytidylyltransferase